MKDNIIKVGAYVFLVIALLVAVVFAVAGVYMFVGFPNLNFAKVSIVGGGLIAAACLIALATFALFESMIESIGLKKEFTVLEESAWRSESRDEHIVAESKDKTEIHKQVK